MAKPASLILAMSHLLASTQLSQGAAAVLADAKAISFLRRILLLLGTVRPSEVCHTAFSPERGLPDGNYCLRKLESL